MSNHSRKRRRASWGSITEIERGKRYVIRYWASLDERGYRRCCETVRGSREQAERRRAELMLDHSRDAPCPTVGTVWSRYALPDMERMVENGDLSKSTIDQYRGRWRRHVEPRWGGVQCCDVRPLAIQQWIYTLGHNPAREAMQLMMRVMDYAVRYEFVTSNPARERYILPSKSSVERRDVGVWRLAELEGVWQRLHGTWMEPAFLVAAFGGTRVGESLGPKAGEVSLRDVNGASVALVPIVRQVNHSGRVDDRLKNEQSRRTIAIPGRAAERIAELAASRHADSFLTDDGFGGFISQHRYMDAWRKMGMEHPFTNLRNSWQTWMRWEMRVEPYYIEPMMGHRIEGTTGMHYDRPQADVFADVVAEAYARYPFDEGWKLPLSQNWETS